MAIKVSLVLPNNLQSTFLRGNFIDDGAGYSTRARSVNPANDLNRHTLTFGFELLDTETRQPVALNRIVSLEISNDPNFISEPTSRIVLEDWPSGGGFDDTKDYRITLNPAYFFGTSNTVEQTRHAPASGTGLFIVENWPLSANGGLSTVYFRVTVESVALEQGTYPDNYGIFDQIVWQTEYASAPGQPITETFTPGWTGKRTLWRFRAAEEGQTGVYSTGIARYLADIIDIRRNDADNDWQLMSTKGSSLTGVRRKIASSYAAQSTAIVHDGLSTNYNFTTFTNDNVTYAPGTSPMALGGANPAGAVLYTDFYDIDDSVPIIAPDYACNIHSRLVLANPETQDAKFQLRIAKNRWPFSNTFNAGQPECNELVVQVELPNDGPPVASYWRITDDIQSAVKTMTLPAWTRQAILDGGVFEAYLQTSTWPAADNHSILSVYFTPDSRPEQSILLAHGLVPKIIPQLGPPETRFACGIYAAVNSGTAQFYCEEIAHGAGRFLLGVDVGDCRTDDILPYATPVVNTTQLEWATHAARGDWLAVESQNLGDVNTTVVQFLGNATYGLNISVNPDSSEGYDNSGEAFCATPTLSTHVLIDLSVSIAAGNFYLALSPTPPSTGWTMHSRCNAESASYSDEPFAPTLLIGFDQARQQIYLTQRLGNGVLITKPLRAFTPTATDTLQVRVYNVPDALGTGQQTMVNILRGTENVGFATLDHALPGADKGLGWYVAVGVASLSHVGNANTNIRSVKVASLPSAHPERDSDPATVRHLVKATTATGQHKPWLGQCLLTGRTDPGEYVFGEAEVPAQTRTVVAATTGSIANFASMPLSIDGVTLALNDYILVKDQVDTRTNGVYRITSMSPRTATYQPTFTVEDILVRVLGGTVNGGFDYVPDPYTESDTTPYVTYRRTAVATRFQVLAGGHIPTSITPQLFEVKARSFHATPPTLDYGVPQVRFYSDNNNAIDAPLTNWINASDRTLTTPPTQHSPAPTSDLVQFPLADDALNLTAGSYYWAYVQLPPGYAFANAFNTDLETKATTEGLVWYKLYAKAMQRYDNVAHRALLQARLLSDSHARVLSLNASSLSLPIQVDLMPPVRSTLEPTLLPTLHSSSLPTSRTASVDISAYDADSGVCAFRIAHQIDGGALHFSPWQSWREFGGTGEELTYTVYLSGITGVDPVGGYYTEQRNRMSQEAGQRRVWAQIMDGAGNISEALPLTSFTMGMYLVDTVPPEGSASFVDGDASAMTQTNNRDTLVSLSASDRASGVRDFRFRQVGEDTWSAWQPMAEFARFVFENDAADGIQRLEVQFRDYGNNRTQPRPLWEMLYATSNRNTLVNQMCAWQSPTDTAEQLYACAIQSDSFTDFYLIDSLNAQYSGYTAFYAYSNGAGDGGRRVFFRPTDVVTVRINGVTAASSMYTFDYNAGLIVFDTAPAAGATLRVDIERKSALLMRWNDRVLEKVLDFGYLGETVMLSMLATENSLFLGSGTGRIYEYDGRVVSSPIYTNSDEFPFTALHLHQFEHESEPYVYAGTGEKPRLYRAKLSLATNGSAWERVYASGYFDQAGAGVVTDFASAFNKLFISTDSGTVYAYVRRLVNTTGSAETETMEANALLNANIGTNDGTNVPVTALATMGEMLVAAAGDRPEVFSYVEELRDQPVRPEDWWREPFDFRFKNDPSPWQFFHSTSTLPARLHPGIGSEQITDPSSPSGYRPVLILTGAASSAVAFVGGSGTDFEAVMSRISPQRVLGEVVVATTANIANLAGGAPNTLDGVSLANGMRVLVKNQTEPKLNGVYTVASVGTGSNGTWTRATDFNSTSDTQLVPRTAVRVQQGALQADTWWVLQAPASGSTYTIDDGNLSVATPMVWAEPTYTLELETMHLSGDGKQGFAVSDGYRSYEVSLDRTEVVVTSGETSATATYATPPPVTAFAANMGTQYPERGVKKLWNFSNTSTTDEDSGPYWIGNDDSTSNLQGWAEKWFVNTLTTVNTELSTDASFSKKHDFLRLTPDAGGDPRIENKTFGTFDVDTQTKLFIRARVPKGNTDHHAGSKLRVYYAASADEPLSMLEADVAQTGDWFTYIFQPAWQGEIGYLAVEYAIGKDATVPSQVDIAFIAVASDGIQSDIHANFLPVRLTVTGRRVRVYMGRCELPVIDVPALLSLPARSIGFRFGKLDASEAQSTWAYSELKVITHQALAPVTRRVYPFRLMHRFPSAGSVRCLIPYGGTIYALTDGYVWKRSSASATDHRILKRGDNPDDRASKMFAYDANVETWRAEAPPFPRRSDGQGVIRPLCAAVFDGRVVASGQIGTIRTPA